ncbi:S-layer homology domain-containing protein [Peptoclostridium litorale DSM 5388]|uniref:SLH domain-containing protein n=1 Tax=Peptoclostridium litorale DSM 5388 TaxID=1121324 RepID=A0A069RF05_PEPLI|nr:S-layer homology domain-containing protein [Peptoclostridium litorale]KDR94790.1 hypothetical protein CLIT_13c01120 [Peptoclostridium litorale DSM 5388]SIN92743.1 S-layer homology domain-containing protein [Peptoclostridium litorale DSM 5388]
MSQWVKKGIAILIAVIFVVTSIQFSFGAEKFTDMSTHWSKQYVDEMVGKGILSGYPDGKFKPEEAITRMQALVAISRMFEQSEVDSIYNSNKSKYESDFKEYSIPTWAQKPLVFCIEKEIFLRNFMDNGKLTSSFSILVKNGKESPAQRWEVAIYIGKALGYSDKGKVYVLDFEDVKDIPSSAVPYIGALVEKKIISGQTKYPSDKLMFNPYGAVKRGEMAKILKLSNDIISKKGSSSNSSNESSGSDASNSSDASKDNEADTSDDAIMTISGEVYSVTQASGDTLLMIETSKGTKLSFKNNTGSVVVKLGEKKASVSDIAKGDNVKIRVSGDKLVSVDIEEREESVEGYFVKAYFNLGTDGLSRTFIQVKDGKNTREFAIDGSSDIEIDGKDSSVYDIQEEDRVEVEIENGVVDSLKAFSKSGRLTGFVKEVNASKDYMILVDEDDDDKEYKFDIDDDVDVKRNNDKSGTLSDIRVGDKVEIELEYSVIVEIDAESVSKDVEGIIKEIIISSEPKITILDKNDKLKTYRVSPDFEVEIDNDSAGLYDLRLNYEAKLELETDLVTKIECDDEIMVSTITGEIEDVDTGDNIIRIRDNRTNKSVYVRYKSSTTMENYNGKSMDEDDFDEDDIISVIGEDKLGSISADRIIKIQ